MPLAVSAVYALLDVDRQVLYVGATTNLLERLKAHRYRDWWEHVTTVSWIKVDTDHLRDTEAIAISHLAPPHNIACNHGPATPDHAVLRREAIDSAKRWPQIGMHQRRAQRAVWVEALVSRRRPPKQYGWVEL